MQDNLIRIAKGEQTVSRETGKWATTLVVVLMLVAGLATVALAEEQEEGLIDVVVSPNVLNLESYGGSVSLHTDIAYGLVEEASLTVNDAEVDYFWTFADSRGQLVVKCSLTTIMGMVEVGEATFVLTVQGKDGITYSGTDLIEVISQSGVNRKG